MIYKIIIDTRNSDRFDIGVPSEEMAKKAMLNINTAIEAKTLTVAVTPSDWYLVSEIISFSYEKIPSFWDCFKTGSESEAKDKG